MNLPGLAGLLWCAVGWQAARKKALEDLKMRQQLAKERAQQRQQEPQTQQEADEADKELQDMVRGRREQAC